MSSFATLLLLIVVRELTVHVVCEHDKLTLRLAKNLGGGEMLQVEHRGEEGVEASRQILLYHHYHHIFFLYIELEAVFYLSMFRAFIRYYVFFKQTN